MNIPRFHLKGVDKFEIAESLLESRHSFYIRFDMLPYIHDCTCTFICKQP